MDTTLVQSTPYTHSHPSVCVLRAALEHALCLNHLTHPGRPKRNFHTKPML